ncbi:sterile alpha motif domain-containing protein 9 [Esox lucius]|uniref:SAM domain-containing protein n=3 Tax=Esox lucius TaxID=8010 RepID=A0AAY5KS33_ESOLU|nr:sterile alpha motif domain-containing protein 9 [Esox lucius]
MDSAIPMRKWTKEEVHNWLTTQVNINQIYADKLLEEEVSGEYLEDFQKDDLLDLKIKHGPAVKIISMVENLRSGSQPKSVFPTYINKWTKEQVRQWLKQVNANHKAAELLLEEEVSGDCLFFFKKEDLVNLKIKHGASVNIITLLKNLNNQPEPVLHPASSIKVDQGQPPLKQHLCPPQTVSKTSQPNKWELTGTAVPPKIEEPTQHPSALGDNILPSKILSMPSSLTLLQNTLDDLQQKEFKRFKSCLKDSKVKTYKPIAQSHLEDHKCRTDIADLMIKHYGKEDALNVTLEILGRLQENALASRLRSDMGLQTMTRKDAKKDLWIETNQGNKLKNLLTCGGNNLEYYDRFVVVMNKSSIEQLEYLQFLSKLNLFCVLDFDPNSAVEGVCRSYSKSRVANLHAPANFHGDQDVVIKNLNLYKQTSWVFCNGRHDLDNESGRQLEYKDWFREKRREIEQMVSFICNPEVLPNGRALVIFLLLSPVTNRDPVFDTFLAFYSHVEDIVSICESRTTFEKWKDMIKEKCESDITRQSIFELTLSEVNGTIMALGPHNQLSGRLLPSSDCSIVVLQQKDEDRMTALDILSQNQCEKVYDEHSTEFQAFKIKVEEEFYRGGKVIWWNFYFCEKPKAKPFIRREKYDNLKQTIIKSPDSKSTCTLLNLFHHPGCGATTLAMHVMWDLRRDFRCAVLKDHTLPESVVAVQVKHLMRLGSKKCTPVLLLVDDSKEESTQTLQHCIRQAMDEENTSRTVEDSSNSKVLIMSCVRCHNPEDQYKHCPTNKQYITAKLTQNEQDDFEEKLVELKENHEKPENFYSFMIMKSNFDQKYIADVVGNTLKDFDMRTKKAQLLAFLALLNSYDAESDISMSLCEDFLGLKGLRKTFWEQVLVLDKMEPYSNLLRKVNIEERGGYKGIRILHHDIASACLEELDRNYKIKRSGITLDMLHCDLLFKTSAVKDALMQSIHRMLVERQRKKVGLTYFSPLIEIIHSQEGGQTITDIFVKASSRFVKRASIPQALSRYLYLYEQDFPQALQWAEKAKRVTENSYTADTVGQVHKSNLKHNIEKQKAPPRPDDFETNLKIAQNAIKAFQKAQNLAMNNETEDETDENLTKTPCNTSGYIGEMETTLTVFEMIGKLPFFEVTDPVKKMYMQSFLKGTIPITHVPKEENDIHSKYVEVIEEHSTFLLALKPQVKKVFEFFNGYFTYVKGNNTEKEEALNQRKISQHFTRYVSLVCSLPEEISKERASKPELKLNMDIENHRKFLEESNADTFAGILAKLHLGTLEKIGNTAEEMNKITESYTFLHNNSVQIRKEETNFILASIILHTLYPKSKHVKKLEELSDILMKTLQDIGVQSPFPEPYYLAMLLLWPRSNTEDTDIKTYVNSLRKACRKGLPYLFRRSSTITHFYLGPKKGLQRLVTKPKLDECFAGLQRSDLAQLWRSGNIFKEKEIIDRLYRVNGTVEQSELYAKYGQLKIPVRPAYIGAIRSGYSAENVSFFLGFAIDGPLAYNIRYENEPVSPVNC